MGLLRRLSRSFRGKARPSSAKTRAPAVVSSRAGSSVGGVAEKRAPPPARPPVPGAKTATTTPQASLTNGQVACGCGISDSAGAKNGSSVGSDEKGCASASVSTSNAAESVGRNNGGAANTVPRLKTTTDADTLRDLTSQVSDLRAELASLRVIVRSLESRLESRVSQGPTAPRRLPRANSYHPETQSLVTSSLSLEEGPNCVLKDDEFYDALTISLLHLEAESDKRDELRRKKEEEMQEELKRQKEREDGEDSKAMKEGNEHTRLDGQHKHESDEHKKSKEENTGSEDRVQDAKKSDEFAPSDDSQGTGDHHLPTATKSAPAKPSRSLSKTSSTEQEPTDSAAASSAQPCQGSGPVAAAGATPAPQRPLPPAAAPRGGCSGNCSLLGHPLAPEIERVITEQLSLVTADVSDGWTLFAQQGDMRMYKLEVPADNHSVDPLKAVSKAHGVTARELCRRYWEPAERLDWETTVDRVTVLARPDPSTVVCHQLHRRIWPAQQRDTVFWSHLCRRRVAGREWSIVVNHSISGHPAEPPAPPGAVRASMTSTLAGRDEEPVSGDRRKLRCHVAYSSHVNPGGWAPTAGLRLVYKREYPRFLQRFTSYVTQKSRGQPVEA